MTYNIAATHQKCPQCGHDDCFTLFDDGNGYCHSVCNGLVLLNKGTKDNYDTFDSSDLLPLQCEYRKIPSSFWNKHNTVILCDPDTNEPKQVDYLYPGSLKTRILPKNFGRNKGFKSDKLFLMDLYNAGSSKVLTITEGEDDAVAVRFMLNGDWPVVALPSASISKALLRENKEYIDSFQNIVICTDSDEAGDRAAVILETTFPNKCYRVSMTKFKDPMEYHLNDAKDDFVYAWINRQKYVKPFDTHTPEQFKKLFHEAVDDRYVPTGIAGFDEVALGLFQGHFTVFTSPEGVGKTELLRMLEYNLIKNHPDIPFAYCHLEETPQRSLLGLCSYHLQKNVTRKDLIEDEDEILRAIDEIAGRETLHQFKIGVDEDPMVLVERIKYYANVCGCQYVFFEPLQDLAAQRKNDLSVVQWLDQLSIQLSRTASETGCGIITVAHMNDDGNIRDSRQIGKQASIRVDLERDLHSTDDEERNKTRLFVRKNRPASMTGFAGELKFDPHTFTLSESYYPGDF